MNHYPLWKYILIIGISLLGILYALPNFFGESPAVQISSAKPTTNIDYIVLKKVEKILKSNDIVPKNIIFDNININNNRSLIFVCFTDINNQFKAKTLLEKKLNINSIDPTYIISFNLLSNTPQWLKSLHAFPMHLGLDLRGGVHFLMKLDMKTLLNKRMQDLKINIRKLLHEKNIFHKNITYTNNQVIIQCADLEICNKSKNILSEQLSKNTFKIIHNKNIIKLIVELDSTILKQAQKDSIKRNISTISKRIHELNSITDSLIQQQGDDRIVVQLPGVQDISRAKSIIGRAAALEVRMIDESNINNNNFEKNIIIPPDFKLFKLPQNTSILLSKDPVITGDYISTAFVSFDKNHQPSVSINLNSDGGKKMRDATHNKIGKAMAIILIEKDKSEVLTVATIRDELGSKFQITGIKTIEANNDLALLLRAGSLAVPMEIIQERVIGPQLGIDNIKQGFNATLYGFAIITIFMIIYYQLFGLCSACALLINVFLLIAILSIFQATLTLPGIAAIALTLGMAIDSNVLINERIREELRNGYLPKIAISIGFRRAWITIIDSNITILIASLALLVFSSGAIRSFAIVHCLGILTSIFSAVFFSRSIINLWYGRKKKIISLAIG